VPGPERDIVKDAAILAQGDFLVGSAVDVVKDNFRYAFARKAAQIGDADDTRGG
jgi:hypothetical protein